MLKDVFSRLTGGQAKGGIHSPEATMIEDPEGRYKILVGSRVTDVLSECAGVSFSDIEHLASRVVQACSAAGLSEAPPFHIFLEAFPNRHPTEGEKVMNAARLQPPGFEVSDVRFDRAVQIFETALREEMKAATREVEGAYEKAGMKLGAEARGKVSEGIKITQATLVRMELARELARLLAADPSSARHSSRSISEMELLADAIVFEAFRETYESAGIHSKNGFLAALGRLCDLVEAERSPQGSFQRFHTMRKKAREVIENFKKTPNPS